MNDIVISGLRLELESARKKLYNALWEVGHRMLEDSSGKERLIADKALEKIQKAADYFDRVQDELQEAERARIAAFNASSSAASLKNHDQPPVIE